MTMIKLIAQTHRPGRLTGDRIADKDLIRRCGVPYSFPAADYDRWLAHVGQFGIGFETLRD